MTPRNFDPQGKQSLFTAPVQAPPDHLNGRRLDDGKRALYSSGAPQAGTVLVECGSCGERHRTNLVRLGAQLLPFSAWVPGRRRSHYMRCPGCNRFAWCHIGWLA